MQRILAIWLPNWPIQRVLHDKPALERRPVILQYRTRRGLCVFACSRAACERGVCVDLPVAEATALLRHTDQANSGPDAMHLETHDPVADRAALLKLAAWCHRFSPLVGLEESPAPNTLLLNVAGVLPLFGGEPVFAEQVLRSLQRQRLSVRLGLSDTLGAAWALAHFGHGNGGPGNGGHGNGGQENVGGGHPDQAGLQVLPELPVEQLPLAALRLPGETVDILQRLGLQRIGQLQELPRVELESRFGPQLLRRLDQAFGQVSELIQPIQLPLEFTAEWLFEYPMPRRKAVERVVRQLVERLCFTLVDHGRGVLRLCGRITCQDASPVHWEVGLFRPSADVEHIWKLVETQLERLPLPGPALSVALRAHHHARLQARQQELFDQQQRSIDSPQVATLVDCLASQLGREAVVRCVLQRDVQPERAYRDEPLVGELTKQKRSAKKTLATGARQASCGLLDRPLQLLDPPLALEALAVAPDGPPISFCYLGDQHEVARHWGPERIETGWWRQRGIRRDYYRVETTAGRRFWLFRCLHQGHWWLHGIFK